MGPLRVDDGFDDKFGAFASNALAQGYSLGDVQAFKEQAREMHNRELLARRSMAPTQAAQSTETGRAGGAKGLALDVLPFGRVIEKVANPNAGNITAGEIGVEAALSLAPFGLGRVIKGVRAAKGAKAAVSTARQISKTAGIPEGVVKQAAKSSTGQVPATPSGLFAAKPDTFLQNAGAHIRGYGRGVRAGMRPEGAPERLLPSGAKEINTLLDSIGAKGGIPKQLRRVEEVQGQTRKIITQTVAAKNKAVTPEQLQGVVDRVKTNILGTNGKGIPGFDPKVHGKLADNFGRQMVTAKDTVGLENFRKSLDDVINYSRNPASPDPMTERIAQAFRREVDREVTKLVPTAKKAKGLYGRLEGAKDALVVNAPTNVSGSSTLFGTAAKMGLPGALDKTGRAVQFAGRNMSRPAIGIPAAQAAVRVPFIGGDDQLPVSDPTMTTTTPSSTSPTSISNMPSPYNSPDGSATTTDFSSPQTAMPNTGQAARYYEGFQRAMQAGDMKSAEALLDFAEQAAKFEKMMAENANTGGAPNVTKVTAQQYGLAQSGSQSLQQLAQMLQADPGVLGRSATPGRKLPVVGGYISNAAGTGEFDAIGYNIADAILRLRTGATANEGEVKNLQSQIMPRAGDNPDTVRRKLSQIEQIFGGTLQLASQPNNGSSFEDELMQTMAGQQYSNFPSDPSQVSF